MCCSAGKDSFYEELAKVQKVEMDKREKEPISKNEMVQAATKKAEEEAKKRLVMKQVKAQCKHSH